MRVFLTVVAAPFYAAGWVAGQVINALGFLRRSVVLGWSDARAVNDGAA